MLSENVRFAVDQVLATAVLNRVLHVCTVMVISAGEERKSAVFKGLESVREESVIRSNRRRQPADGFSALEPV